MSIFRREDPSPPPRPTPSREPSRPSPPPPERPQPAPSPSTARTRSQIAPGCTIKGAIEGQSDLVVDGTVEGQIRTDSDVSIGREGTVKGDVSAKSVRIGGRIVGNVRGSEKVEILDSGRLEGDVVAPRVVLAEGAFFKGKVEMTGVHAAQGKKPT
jgi:cytoskeletal protein CcmA (bactofilin family)